jgi:hypothetical protein
MADDRMKNDDLQRNMGNKEGQDYGQQSPGRTGQPGQQGGQHAGGQQGGGGKKGSRDLEDEDLDTGAGRTGGQNRGGQNR